MNYRSECAKRDESEIDIRGDLQSPCSVGDAREQGRLTQRDIADEVDSGERRRPVGAVVTAATARRLPLKVTPAPTPVVSDPIVKTAAEAVAIAGANVSADAQQDTAEHGEARTTCQESADGHSKVEGRNRKALDRYQFDLENLADEGKGQGLRQELRVGSAFSGSWSLDEECVPCRTRFTHSYAGHGEFMTRSTMLPRRNSGTKCSSTSALIVPYVVSGRSLRPS